MVLLRLYESIAGWRRRRKARAARHREDALLLLLANPETAYYDAHRLATRARKAGDLHRLSH